MELQALRSRGGGRSPGQPPAGSFKHVNGWFDLEPETRELLVEALERFYPKDCGEFLASVRFHPASRHGFAVVTRQAVHARIQRLISAAVACCAILGTEENKFADLFFKPDFAQLRPYSVGAFAKFETLLMEGRTGDLQGWKRLWRRGAEVLLAAGCQGTRCSMEEAVVAHCAMSLMYGCVILAGGEFQKAWRQTFQLAERRGALKNQYVNLNLSLLGAFAGVSEPYLRFASSARNHPVDSADLFLFVRHDIGAETNDLLWKIVIGRPPPMASCLYLKKPSSSIARAIHYVRTSMRRKYYFQNPGLTMAVLVWTWSIAQVLADREMQSLVGAPAMEKLKREFARIARVQQMEKNRFANAVAQIKSTRQQEKIEAMWQRIRQTAEAWYGTGAS